MPNIYFNDKQIEMLRDIVQSYIDIMGEGEETLPILDKEMPIISEIKNKLRGNNSKFNKKDLNKALELASNIISRHEERN